MEDGSRDERRLERLAALRVVPALTAEDLGIDWVNSRYAATRFR
jgi:hypothetical protein